MRAWADKQRSLDGAPPSLGSCQGTGQAETLEASLLGAFGVVVGVPSTFAGVPVGMVLAVGRQPSPLGPENCALHARHRWCALGWARGFARRGGALKAASRGVPTWGLPAWSDKGRQWGWPRAGSHRSWEPSDSCARPQDVARLIVERSTIMSHLFSKRSCRAESDAVLAALLSIFSRYVRRMRKSKEGEEVYSWVRRAGPPPRPRAHPTPELRPFTPPHLFPPPRSQSRRTRSSFAGPVGRRPPCTSWWSMPWSSS